MKNSRRKTFGVASRVALVGIMAATVECGKLVLAALPNVEIVTLLLALYGYTFGYLGVVAAFVFVCIEPVIWGFGTWMVSYLIHWPIVALVFLFLRHTRVKNRFIFSGIAVLLTFLFGVLTSLVDVGIFMGRFDNLAFRFSILYMRGIPFYIAQIACNAVLFVALFPFLSEKLLLATKRMNL